MKAKWISSILLITIFIGIVYWIKNSQEDASVHFDSQLIEKQIENVSKLIITEGHYAEVISYQDDKKYLLDFFTFQKKALVVVNTKAMVSYDLKQLEYRLDPENKILYIDKIPKPELEIFPDIKFYDITQSTFNTFTAEDYNKINTSLKKELRNKISNSSLMKNAENRLLSELSNLFILTKELGWTTEYNSNTINILP